MSADQYIGHFSLWGDFDTDQVTHELGLTPSAVYRKGETALSEQPALISTWDLHCPPELKTEEQIDHLLTLLSPHADALQRLSTRFHADFNVVGDQDFALSPTTLHRLADLNVKLNFFHYKDDVDEAAVSA